MGLLDMFLGQDDPNKAPEAPDAPFQIGGLSPQTSDRLLGTLGAVGQSMLAGNRYQWFNPQVLSAALKEQGNEADRAQQRAAIKAILKRANPSLSEDQLNVMSADPQTARLALAQEQATAQTQAEAKAGQQASGLLGGLFGGAPAQPGMGAGPGPGTGGAGGGPPPFSGSQAERAKVIFDGVVARGGSPLLASAAVGNFTGESDLDPGIGGDKDRTGNPTSFGLGQWRGERLDALKALAGKQGKDWRDPDVQLDHMMTEMNGGDAGAVRANRMIQAARTPEEAAAIFAKHFERPSDEAFASSLPKRAGAAAQAYSLFGSGPAPVQVADASGAMPAMPRLPEAPRVPSAAQGGGPDPLAGFVPSGGPGATDIASLPEVGSGRTPPPPPAPLVRNGARDQAGNVRVAENERQTQELEGRMNMLPPSVYGITQTAQGGYDPRADMPAQDAGNADFFIPPGGGGQAPQRYGPTTQRALEAQAGRQQGQPQAAPSGGSPDFPLNDPKQAAAAIPKLLQVLLISNLPDSQKAQAKAALDYALGVVKPTQRTLDLMQAGLTPGTPEYVAAYKRQLSDNRPSAVQEYEYSRNDPGFDAYRDKRSAKSEPQIGAQVAQRREAAESLGLVAGSPGYQSYVLTGKMPNEDKPGPSAGDKKVIQSAEDELPNIDNTIASLARAKELNPQTYTGSTAKYYAQIGTSGIPGAGLIADTTKAGKTREFGQLMSMQAITAMSQTLKGATTDAEMGRFMEILGDPSTPPEIRGRTIDRLMTLAERQKELATSRLNELREGTYYKPNRAQGGGSTSSPARAAPASPSRPAFSASDIEAEARRRGLIQ